MEILGRWREEKETLTLILPRPVSCICRGYATYIRENERTGREGNKERRNGKKKRQKKRIIALAGQGYGNACTNKPVLSLGSWVLARLECMKLMDMA